MRYFQKSACLLAGALATVALASLLGCNEQGKNHTQSTAGSPATATTGDSWALLNFTKVDSSNPIMGPSTAGRFTDPILKQPVLWEEKDVFNPAVVVRNDMVYMLYRAENKVGKLRKTSRIGLATSSDGIHFTRRKEPVLHPDNDAYKKYEWSGGTEDPRVVESEDGTYYMTYTAYDGDKARLQIASSPDLVHWTKYGNAFAQAAGGKYVDKWSKSGSIVSRYEADGRLWPPKSRASTGCTGATPKSGWPRRMTSFIGRPLR